MKLTIHVHNCSHEKMSALMDRAIAKHLATTFRIDFEKISGNQVDFTEGIDAAIEAIRGIEAEFSCIVLVRFH